MGFKLGINAEAYGRSKVEQNISAIANAGFDAFFTEWTSEAPVKEWAKLGEKNGLIYQSIHAPFKHVNQMWYGSDEGKEYVELLKRCIDDCAAVNVPLMIIHPFIGFKEHTPTEVGLELYGRIVDHAEKKGILLGFENVEGEEYLAAIMDRYRDSSVVRFCWDTGHEQCYNLGKDMMALYGDRLAGTHFNDNKGCLDKNNITWKDDLHLFPFDGIVDWQGVMDRIHRHGYDGILTFELTLNTKPDRDTSLHDLYASMSNTEFYREVYNRAKRIAAL